MQNNDLDRLQSGEGAKFNSALSDLERIHNLLVGCNQARISEDLRLWHRCLQALEGELIAYFNEADFERMEQVRVQNIVLQNNARHFIMQKLHNYEIALRVIRAKKKLGIVADDDINSAAFN